MKEQAASSGSTVEASGLDAKTEQTKQHAEPPKDSVAYETYTKVLEEAKNAKKRLKEFEEKEKLKADADLKAKEDWKALLEQRELELAETKAKLTGLNDNIQSHLKRNAVLKALSGEVPEQYLGLIEIDKVLSNPETGEIDAMSAQNYAKEFESKYQAVVQKPNANKLPNNAPAGSGVGISYDEWTKLPTAKEMKARYKDVFDKP